MLKDKVEFMDNDFLLESEVAQRLYHKHTAIMSILMIIQVGEVIFAVCYHNVQRYLFER